MAFGGSPGLSILKGVANTVRARREEERLATREAINQRLAQLNVQKAEQDLTEAEARQQARLVDLAQSNVDRRRGQASDQAAREEFFSSQPDRDPADLDQEWNARQSPLRVDVEAEDLERRGDTARVQGQELDVQAKEQEALIGQYTPALSGSEEVVAAMANAAGSGNPRDKVRAVALGRRVLVEQGVPPGVADQAAQSYFDTFRSGTRFDQRAPLSSGGGGSRAVEQARTLMMTQTIQELVQETILDRLNEEAKAAGGPEKLDVERRQAATTEALRELDETVAVDMEQDRLAYLQTGDPVHLQEHMALGSTEEEVLSAMESYVLLLRRVISEEQAKALRDEVNWIRESGQATRTQLGRDNETPGQRRIREAREAREGNR